MAESRENHREEVLNAVYEEHKKLSEVTKDLQNRIRELFIRFSVTTEWRNDAAQLDEKIDKTREAWKKLRAYLDEHIHIFEDSDSE